MRVHRPEKYGDDLSGVRHTIVTTNETRQQQSGFESGRVYSGLRGAVPMFATDPQSGERIHLGALEAGTSFTYLLNLIKQDVDTHIAVVLNREHVESTMWPESVKRLFGEKMMAPCNCVLEATSHESVSQVLEQHHQTVGGYGEERGGFELIESNDRLYAAAFQPLQDFIGGIEPGRDPVGQILVWSDVTGRMAAVEAQKWRYRGYALLVYLLLLLVTMMAVHWFTVRLNRAVSERTSELQQVSDHLRQSNHDLVLAQDRVRGFASTASDWFWESDADHRFIYFSPQLYPITGIEPKRLLGRRQDEIDLVGVEPEAVTRHMRLLERHESFRELVYAVERKGKRVWLSINGDPVYDKEGQFHGYRGTGSDISERINHQLEIDRHRSEMERSKDEFFATMSHELRTPLTAIIGNSRHLLRSGVCGSSGCVQNDAMEIIRSIESAGESQLALVNDILDMSKIESGSFVIESGLYDLEELLKQVIAMLQLKAEESGLELKLQQHNRESCQLIGDRQRIEQILINLVGNAIKFTERGGVTLSSRIEGEMLCFEVRDSGIGMSSEVVTSLFRRFQQADSSISRRFGGSGLGLYISKSLAEMMGGVIEVDSREGEGTTFALKLPYRPSDQPVSRQSQQQTEEAGVQQYHGRVLVAEDSDVLQMLERRILEGLGLEVELAENGKVAVEKARSSEFELILMDMQMPEMDGLEATTVIRQFNQTIPIVALTANVMQKHREAFENAGCNGFLEKPIDHNALVRMLGRYLLDEREQHSVV